MPMQYLYAYSRRTHQADVLHLGAFRFTIVCVIFVYYGYKYLQWFYPMDTLILLVCSTIRAYWFWITIDTVLISAKRISPLITIDQHKIHCQHILESIITSICGYLLIFFGLCQCKMNMFWFGTVDWIKLWLYNLLQYYPKHNAVFW